MLLWSDFNKIRKDFEDSVLENQEKIKALF